MNILGKPRLQRLTEIKASLTKRGLVPKHRLGQNFLHDHNIINKLIKAADASKGDIVLEIGPGTGVLTESLLNRGCRVVACEIDEGLSNLLEESFGSNVVLIRGDCLKKKQLNPKIIQALGNSEWKLIANLPYQIASPLMIELLMQFPNCLGQFITIQYEVAQRLVAKVNSPQWGVLSILAQRLATVSLISKVPPTCFWPQPKVHSACVSLIPKESDNSIDDKAFAKFVTHLFSNRRKQIGKILGRDFAFPKGVATDARPATLTINQLEELFRAI